VLRRPRASFGREETDVEQDEYPRTDSYECRLHDDCGRALSAGRDGAFVV
jgi:hypothetical protein